ncbi:MAG: SUMF1/EgtB/PvdO family nonheme iron enzyme [Lentisphaerae bacterium]|nr:SUMF1/EgtB/PvdO family nonheme iron enzyme [Lentisphaerota bacterium]
MLGLDITLTPVSADEPVSAKLAPPVTPVAASNGGPADNQPWVSPLTGMEFVWISALKMWVGKYEVANGEYRKFKADHNSEEFKGHSLLGDRQPVVMVNFDDAKAFADWLTKRERQARRLPEGYRFRLPSEDEWLTFAQCGDGWEYPWGNTWPPPNDWNYHGQEGAGYWSKIEGHSDGFPVTCPVEKSGKNDWGLYGVGGNVWEVAAKGKDGASFGAWRGASWNYDYQRNLRCSYRIGHDESNRDYDSGFRLVLSPASP